LQIMGDAGIKGSMAGTTLRRALLNLINPVGQTNEGLKALGLTAEDLQGPDGLLPFPEIVAKISREKRGMDTASRNAALAQVFGARAVAGMTAVIDAGAPKVDKYTRALEAADGAAQSTAETMMDNVA